ncbi:hypothetical protein DGG96_07400 [Legionella qingyii]|uniref:Uncharacterized protein n=1 Tax=Legionella qingyii TaxID=2184757 RepID=A0A317U6Z6_9GAMM|nr:hypothetical protein DGG96_07400 [Legionella qingyii]
MVLVYFVSVLVAELFLLGGVFHARYSKLNKRNYLGRLEPLKQAKLILVFLFVTIIVLQVLLPDMKDLLVLGHLPR